MMHALAHVAGELVRRQVDGLLTVTLAPLANKRERAEQRFSFTLTHAAIGGGEPLRIVDARGYVAGVTLADVARWLSRWLSGGTIDVAINVTDWAGVPAPWTPGRLSVVAAQMDRLQPAAMRAAAAAKAATVETWADSPRRRAVLDAAARVLESAAVIDYVRGDAPEWPVIGQ